MDQVLIVMAILGCGDVGSTQCQTVHKIEAGYTTVDACNAASPGVLEKLTDLSYPVIMAQCQKQMRPAVAEASPRPQG